MCRVIAISNQKGGVGYENTKNRKQRAESVFTQERS